MITKPLGEIADILISNVDKKSKDNEKEVKLCNFVDVYYNWAITANNEKDFMIATASDTAIDKFTLHKGDVAITKDSETRNDIGVATYISEKLDNVLLGYHCILIHPNEEIVLGKYLNVVLHSSYAQKYFEANASGSGQRYTLTDTLVKEMPIPLPDINIQRKIGDILSYIDRKIENNNKINGELESMAKTIYDYWFLQFEFPNEERKPYKSSGGKMVWNEELKREIPEGWEVVKIGKILDKYPKTESVLRDDYEKGILFPIIDQSKYFICGYTDDKDKVLHLKDAIVFGDHTNFAKYINFDFARGADGTQIVVSKNKNLPNYLLYLQIISLPVIEQGYSRHFKFLKEQFVFVPNKIVSEKYMKIIEDALLLIKKNIFENRELSLLRDFLLPMLMNGQIGFK